MLEAEAKAKKSGPSGNSPKPGATKELSAGLWREGKTIDEIAAERGLARSTIEGHLAHALMAGLIDWDDSLIPQERRLKIELAIDPGWEEITAGLIKERLPADFGYGEIHLALARRKLNQLEEK